MRRSSLTALAALCFASHANAIGRSANVDIVDTATGRVLPLYHHAGRYYVAGEPGHEYGIRLANREDQRLLAVASVDGVNVVSGETAAPDQTGYVLDRYAQYDILGWRKSLDRVASFYFTSLPDSYAARTGRARDVGVIGVALFRENVPTPVMNGMIEDRASSEPAPPPSAAAPAASGASRQPPLSRDATMAEEKAASQLGTGHGRSQDSNVVNTDFERSTSAPAEVVAIYYDSRSNLIAQGVIPSPASHYHPNPFPNGFVPDP